MTTSTEHGEFTHGLDKPFSVTLLGSKREQDLEAGMLHGIEAYNDAMGY
jgi:hypothetical protein